MANTFNIDTEEVKRILSLHESFKRKTLNEQPQPTEPKKTVRNRQELADFFSKAKSFGCIKDMNMDFTKFYRTPGEDKAYIKGPSRTKPGFEKRFYDDFTWIGIDPKTNRIDREDKWVCPKMTETPPAPPPQKDANQKKVLEILSTMGWFAEPAPTQVELDQGLFTKIDLSGKDTDENVVDANSKNMDVIEKFGDGKYFEKIFHVYRKEKPQTNLQRVEREKPTRENCRVATENLFNEIERPRQFRLTPKERKDALELFKDCAQNSAFLGIRGNKFKTVAQKYGVSY